MWGGGRELWWSIQLQASNKANGAPLNRNSCMTLISSRDEFRAKYNSLVGGDWRFCYYVSTKSRNYCSTPPFCDAEFVVKQLTLVMCQIEKNRTQQLKDPPICNLMHSFSIKLLQIWAMSCHAGVTRKWRDIVRFFISQGYTEISPNITYTVIVNNR